MNRPDHVPEERDDWTLVEGAAAGSEQDFERLVNRHQQLVHRLIFRAVGHEATALDLAQETFVRAWFALPRLQRSRNDARFSTWLCRIALNLCRDHWKSRAAGQARMTRSLQGGNPGDNSAAAELDPASETPRPDQAAMAADLQRAADKAVAALPDRWRIPFLLAVVERLPHAEIAALTGTTVKSVESRVYRARRRLTVQLRRLGFDVDG